MAGAQEEPLLVLGIMSGTSIDAVDSSNCLRQTRLSRLCEQPGRH
jgi:1,6-anhydro-N-acetylmuramate kinase